MNPRTPEDQYERLEAHENVHRLMRTLSTREEIALRLRYGIPNREIGKDPVNRVAIELRKRIEELNETIKYLNGVIDGRGIVIKRLERSLKKALDNKEINASEYVNHLRSKYCPFCRNKIEPLRKIIF